MLRIELTCYLILAPSKAPDGFAVTAKSSTSIAASWELPPAQDRNGIIRGFKLFYKKKGSSGLQTIEPINSESIRNKVVTGLDVYTEYEFQVLAYTSVGDGPKSSKQYARTKEEGKKLIKDDKQNTSLYVILTLLGMVQVQVANYILCLFRYIYK